MPGFWRSLWLYRRDIFFGWDLWASAAFALAARFSFQFVFTDSRARDMAEIELAIGSALLGTVLAGLAIIVSFMSEDYLGVVARARGGLERQLFHFWFTAALSVVTVLLAGIDVWLGDAIVPPWHMNLVSAHMFFFVWTLLATLNLIPFVSGHGSNRALQVVLKEEEQRRTNAANTIRQDKGDVPPRYEPGSGGGT